MFIDISFLFLQGLASPEGTLDMESYIFMESFNI